MGKSKRNTNNLIRHHVTDNFSSIIFDSDDVLTPELSIIDCFHNRIAAFNSFIMDRNISPSTSDNVLKMESIKSDAFPGKISSMIEVRDIGPPLSKPEELEEARLYFKTQPYTPVIWRTYLEKGEYAPFLFKRTGFINLFSDDTIIMVDMYRPPWKPYFTSDVFFDQWLRAINAGANLLDLPIRFPSTLYIHNIKVPDDISIIGMLCQ
jgi:hypothetical protein